VPERKALIKSPKQGPDAIDRIRSDTYVGMAISNLVGLAIMVTTAATLHVSGVTNIQTSSQAAQALKPIAGEFAFAVFALGIVGTAFSLSRRWPDRRLMHLEKPGNGLSGWPARQRGRRASTELS
jgi:Mn2+/Fe2+ NRAMP family transporter